MCTRMFKAMNYALFRYIVFEAIVLRGLVFSDHCPLGPWVNVNGTCYYFSTQELTWQEAFQECQNLQSDLLIFYGEQDRLEFVQAVQSSNDITERWWTSLSDYHHPGIWTWGQSPAAVLAEGNSVVWNVEPDDSNHIENCGAINIQGTLSDEKCNEKHGYICELPTVGGCPDGWLKSDTACYLFSDFSDPYSLMTWSQAREYCMQVVQQNNNTPHLVYLETVQEMKYIRNQLPRIKLTSQIWWIGMTDQEKEGIWKWTNGIPATEQNLIWTVEPNNLAGIEFCGMLYHNGRFADMPCGNKAKYVCLTPEIGDSPKLTHLGCPPNWIRAGYTCYYFNLNKNYTWQDASTICQNYEGHLLNIRTKDERHWLEFETMRYWGESFWSGLIYHPGDKQWFWASGDKAETALVHWDSEPNDFDGKEDCALILQDGTFNDFACFYSMAYACELQSEDAPCPQGWIASSLEGSFSCYFISNTSDSDMSTWHEARDICVSLSAPLDGYLLAVNSGEERDAITQLLRAKSPTTAGWWTGLNDIEVEGQWVYDTSFNNPTPDGVITWNNEPNNRGGRDYCAVVYYGGRYNDVDCNDKTGFICQRGAGSQTYSSKGSRLYSTTCALISVFIYYLWHTLT